MHNAFLATLQGDDWPQITDVTIDEASATLALIVPPSLTSLEGQFPDRKRVAEAPSVELIARRRIKQIPPQAKAYLRGVTQVWCGFFVLNAL
ncbi:MAG: hypothetical protein AB8G17_04045, partial [Gammaproteobacteria bacterium]